MRAFSEPITMIEEIRRDLAKAPIIMSSRVQATETSKGGGQKTHEAMNYSYSIPASALPEDAYDLAVLGAKYFPIWHDTTQMVSWLALEGGSRLHPLSKFSRLSDHATEEYHRELETHKEGNHYGYTYRERMIGMIPAMESVLLRDRYSRRAYWPIYEQRDAHRASDMTRVPCSLGLHFCIRDIALQGPVLHVTNYQRSCDFNKFFLSDLWFTCLAQRELAKRLQLEPGLINHNIISLHAFIDQEIY